MTQEELQRALLERAHRMRAQVQRNIPDRLRTVLSVDDVLQEVWIAAYRNIAGFVPADEEALDRWLARITTSKTTDAIRSARRVKRGGDRRCVDGNLASLTSLLEVLHVNDRTPSSEVNIDEACRALKMSLEALEPDRQRAIELRYLKGHSHKEIAREMMTTETRVNSLLYKGLRELRNLLGDAAKYLSDVRSAASDSQ